MNPPSPYLDKHPGYLGTPRAYESLRDWLTDHGAILYVASSHGLLTMDPEFLDRWTEAIVRACQWIDFARNPHNHDGIQGVLPAGVDNDKGYEEQHVWNDAWTYKGLVEAARLLKRLNHPRAREIQGWADDYRSDFQTAMRESVRESRVWTAPNGDEVPFIPTALGTAPKLLDKHFFYLDSGPMVLVWSGLMSADDPIMRANVRWYREGPQWRQYRRYSRHRQVPVLDREISSCEPCYSWVYYHTLELGDRHRFSMGLYGLLAAGASQQTYVSSESWETIFGTVFSSATLVHLIVEAALEERGDELHLMRMIPLAFLTNGGFTWQNVPTSFGPVSLKAELNDAETRLNIELTPPSRFKPQAIYLHVPPIRDLEEIRVNGKTLDLKTGRIRLL